MLELAKINTISGTQARSSLSQETVAEYAEAYKAGVNMPPVVVFYDGATYYLADGFHRFFGAKAAGLETIREEVTPGTLRDAILFSLKANETHGLRRTNADKRKAVETMLADAEWAKWSSNEIAKRCGVSHTFVDDFRKSILQPLQDTSTRKPIFGNSEDETAARTVTRNGKTYEQNTANIGKKALAQEPTDIPEQPTSVLVDSSELSALKAENEALRESSAEIAKNAQEAIDDNNSMAEVFESDDRLVAAMAKIKQLTELVRVLEERNRGMLNKEAEAIKAAKRWQRKYDALVKEYAKEAA